MHLSVSTSVAVLAAYYSFPAFSLVHQSQQAAIAGDEILLGSSTHLESRDDKEKPPTLLVEIYNDRDHSINAYIAGKEPIHKTQIFLQADTQEYYNFTAQVTTQAMLDSTPFAIHIAPKQTTTVNLPDYLESGRIWLAEGDLHFKVNQDGSFAEPSGSDPSLPEYNLKWGFVELTHTKDATFVNLSFVDWVGLSIGMSLTSEKGTEEVKGLEGGALKKICEEMKQQSSAKDAGGRPEWGQMCVNAADGALVRVISPNIYSSLDRARNSMADFYTSDIDAMWTRYGKEDLVIHMQSEENGLALPTAGQGVSATCRVQGANMTCDRTAGAYSYGKPTTADIWGCDSGPFVVGPVDTAIPITMFHSRIIPRLCAMFTRGTHALTDGNTQPYTDITQYYKHPVCNHYSRIVHNHLDNLKGYAFAYDDVNPDGIDHNAAGVLFASFPEKFHIDVKRD